MVAFLESRSTSSSRQETKNPLSSNLKCLSSALMRAVRKRLSSPGKMWAAPVIFWISDKATRTPQHCMKDVTSRNHWLTLKTSKLLDKIGSTRRTWSVFCAPRPVNPTATLAKLHGNKRNRRSLVRVIRMAISFWRCNLNRIFSMTT